MAGYNSSGTLRLAAREGRLRTIRSSARVRLTTRHRLCRQGTDGVDGTLHRACRTAPPVPALYSSRLVGVRGILTASIFRLLYPRPEQRRSVARAHIFHRIFTSAPRDSHTYFTVPVIPYSPSRAGPSVTGPPSVKDENRN